MRRADFLSHWLLPLAIFFGLLLPVKARGDGINFRSQLEYNASDTETKIKATGEKTKSDFYSFDQLYHVDLSKTIYPYLTFHTGTHFEWNNATSKTEGTKTEAEETILRPFVGLRLDGPIYKAGIDYRRTEIREDTTDLPLAKDFRDEIDTRLGWSPVDLPLFELRYNWTHTYDDPETRDTTDTILNFRTAYTAWRELLFEYNYTRLTSDDRIENFDTNQQTHFGKVGYGHNFWNGGLSLISNYTIRYSTLKFPGGIETNVESSPLQRSQGLSSLNNTPDDGPALSVNNALIDGNLTASAGIDIGSLGDQTRLINIGLDFGFEVNVDEIRIWVDRRLTSAVAGSFSWDVYTSPDNTDNSSWTLIATVSPASFGTFENRFEIGFPSVKTRFIKVVTSALSPTVSGASNFQHISVTEMQAFITLTSAQAQRSEQTTLQHNYDMNLNARLSDKTALGYSLQYNYLDQDLPSQKRIQLLNNLFLTHRFNEIFSGSTRISRTDDKLDSDSKVTYSYGASIKGAYLSTLSQTLNLSGTNIDDQQQGSTYNYAIALRSDATLYTGWSAFLDLGSNWNLDTNDTRADNKTIRFGTNFVPNDKITLDVSYIYTRTDRKRPGEENAQFSNSNLDVQAFFTPLRTLSVTARVNYVKSENYDSTLQEYFLNWSPFPDGTFQLFFNYNETLNQANDQRNRTIGPGFNWTISRHFFLKMFYNFLQTKDNVQEIDATNFRAELIINF